MVARITTGKCIRGVLNYNENKVKSREAELLTAAGFIRSPDRLSFKNKLEWFEKLTCQNLMTKTNAVHISLNFSRQDKLGADDLQLIARDYMQRIGFGDQPYLVYQHFDAMHPHIHIATVNIADGGQRIETHNIGRNQSEKARKAIEELFGLVKAEDQKKQTNYIPKVVPLEAVTYGRQETKAAISAIVREVTDSYKFTSLPELNAVLRQFNVAADRGPESSSMYANKGLVYSIVDAQGKKVSVPIKASSIYGKPTLKNLERKYTPNERARKPYGIRLKHLLDKAVGTAKDMVELNEALQGQGIRILLRENVQGEIYGVTYIDNATRSVFNGSDLGKAYAAKALMQRLPLPLTDSIQPDAPSQTADTNRRPLTPGAGTRQSNENSYPAAHQPAIQKLTDILITVRHDPDQPDPFRRKKKRRLLS